jgi:hypothetical protein
MFSRGALVSMMELCIFEPYVERRKHCCSFSGGQSDCGQHLFCGVTIARTGDSTTSFTGTNSTQTFPIICASPTGHQFTGQLVPLHAVCACTSTLLPAEDTH